MHAAADETSGTIAARIGASHFAVQRYRVATTGLVSSKLYWRECSVCDHRFPTRYPARMMHELCEPARRSSFPPKCPVYFPVCAVCDRRFCAQSNRTTMHDACRRVVDARIERRRAA